MTQCDIGSTETHRKPRAKRDIAEALAGLRRLCLTPAYENLTTYDHYAAAVT